ncbi:M61 family metallopeptidase [Croceicoccus sediminis]|uniref:M61 family metallopeptidase n=1 Tax=Croceicoccus sediminis TaxID=2571150 RepID=UPI001181D414|nr:M61 family metallopeptidase [Croceicoccus sediminis]
MGNPADDMGAPIELGVDASDVARAIFWASQTMSVAGRDGTITLTLAKWLPAYHAPRGAIDRLAGLEFRADGKICRWQRDPENPYCFVVELPDGAQRLQITHQSLSPTQGNQGRIMVSDEIVRFHWEECLLYPADAPIDDILIEPSLRLPEGWDWACAMATGGQARTGPDNSMLRFPPVDVRTLVDSPVLAGMHAHREKLDEDIELLIVADRADQLPQGTDELACHQRLIAEADALFERRPFGRYYFLMACSDYVGNMGLEHESCSEEGVRATYFSNWQSSTTERDLLPHEYVHAWVGKYRVPAGNYQSDFSHMSNELMWVYEGLTQYYGHVLAARCGLISPDLTREAFALIFATYDNRPGRTWRPLADTDNDPIFTAREVQPWQSWQRSEDYYSEGLLIWLEVDTIIRKGSGGERSLDDLMRTFFAPKEENSGKERMKPAPYRREELVAALNDLHDHDWAAFFASRVDGIAPHAPYSGIENGGYRLVWTDRPSGWLSDDQIHHSYFDFSYSIGVKMGLGARVLDVLWDGPAFQAGMVKGMEILSVGGVVYSHAAMQDELDRCADGGGRVELVVKRLDTVKTLTIECPTGQRYPTLEAIGGEPRLLDAILASRAG